MLSNEDRLSELQIQKLFQAIVKKDVEKVKKIVHNGVPNLVNLADPIQGIYSLHLAVRTNNETLVKVLINLGADCDVKSLEGCTPFMEAAYYGHIQALRLLLEYFPKANLAVTDNSGKNVLHYCLYPTKRHTHCLQSIVNYGIDVDLTMDDKSVLMYACQDGLQESVEILLEAGIDVNKQNKVGETALHIACFYGFKECVRLLIKYGANLGIPNANGERAVHKAAVGGYLGILQVLSAHNADMNVTTIENETPLHYAASYGHQTVCKYLVQRGCFANIKNKNCLTATNLAKENGFKEAMKVCKKGENMRDSIQFSKLYLIKLYDWNVEYQLLIERKMQECGVNESIDNVDKINIHQFLDVLLLFKPPVSDAILMGVLKDHDPSATNLIDYKLFFSGKKFISKKFMVNAEKKLKKGKKGNGKKGKSSILPIYTKVLNTRIKSGGPLSNFIEKQQQITDSCRFTPDHPPKHPIVDDSYWYMENPPSQYIQIDKAIKMEDELSLKMAIKEDSILKTDDNYYKTPLMTATLAGNLEAVMMFVQFGADVNAKDNFMWTPLHFACHIGQKDLVEFLLCNGALINAQSSNGGTPLMRAVEASKIDVVKLLLEKGANVLLKNSKGDSVLEIAMSYGNSDILEIIEEKLKELPQNGVKKKNKSIQKREKLKGNEKVMFTSTLPLTNIELRSELSPKLPQKKNPSLAEKKLRDHSISYTVKHAWMPQMDTEAFLSLCQRRRSRFGCEIDFNDYKAPFEKHIKDLLTMLDETN
ncbi:ankyrin repeat and EF-hand domain-containing protein 1 isoform X3 [Hydra vulgaris]|uniref:Ankyrin repeat and EF-hand domain-containing protein 1 isoform X3 n=1 Tax=Hydra vulgaris TaxID=6087 RepID=A0ABM4BFJ2_HYDVU